MEKEKKNNLFTNVLSAIAGAIVGASIPIIIFSVKSKKSKKAKETNSETDKQQLEKNIKEANKTAKTVDQIFLVPIKKEYVEKIGFGVLGAIKTYSGEDEKGRYNSRMIVGINTIMEIKEYDGIVEGFKVFKNDNDARLYVNKFISDKEIIDSKNKEECMKRLFKLIEDNKKYEYKSES